MAGRKIIRAGLFQFSSLKLSCLIPFCPGFSFKGLTHADYLPILFKPLSTEDFAKLDYSVMGSAFATHKEVGRLADDEVYQSDFAVRLSQGGFKISREVPVTVSFGTFRTVYLPDLVIDERAVYELKAVARLTSEHVAQLLNYLYLVESEPGKLVNFRPASVESKFVNAPLSRQHRQRFLVNEIH